MKINNVSPFFKWMVAMVIAIYAVGFGMGMLTTLLIQEVLS